MKSLPLPLQRKMAEVAKAAQKLSLPSPAPSLKIRNAKNIFLIRSATPELFKKCVKQLRAAAPNAILQIVTHERDRELVSTTCVDKFVFYPYTSGGNYSWENIASLQDELLRANLDTFVMLANNVYGYPHIAEILYKLGAEKLHLFNVNEKWYSLTREELEFKTACSGVYQSICNLFWLEGPVKK